MVADEHWMEGRVCHRFLKCRWKPTWLRDPDSSFGRLDPPPPSSRYRGGVASWPTDAEAPPLFRRIRAGVPSGRAHMRGSLSLMLARSKRYRRDEFTSPAWLTEGKESRPVQWFVDESVSRRGLEAGCSSHPCSGGGLVLAQAPNNKPPTDGGRSPRRWTVQSSHPRRDS